MDLNLDTLKQEILEFLDSAGFAVFYSSPGSLDGFPLVLWDTERHPDYQMFLDVARKSGIKLVMFASREFETSEVVNSCSSWANARCRAKNSVTTNPACVRCVSSRA